MSAGKRPGEQFYLLKGRSHVGNWREVHEGMGRVAEAHREVALPVAFVSVLLVL